MMYLGENKTPKKIIGDDHVSDGCGPSVNWDWIDMLSLKTNKQKYDQITSFICLFLYILSHFGSHDKEEMQCEQDICVVRQRKRDKTVCGVVHNHNHKLQRSMGISTPAAWKLELLCLNMFILSHKLLHALIKYTENTNLLLTNHNFTTPLNLNSQRTKIEFTFTKWVYWSTVKVLSFFGGGDLNPSHFTPQIP